MKSTIVGVGLAVACAVTLSAQSTSPAQSYPSSDSSKKMSSDKAKDKKSMTLSGCLREGDVPGEFVLANVDLSQMTGMKGHDTTSATTPSATSGTTASAAAGDKDTKITLVSAASVNLKEHVGHRVEVTGTMAGMDKEKDKSKTPTGTTGTAAGEATSDTTSRTAAGERGMKSGKAHKMTVQSLKHVSATCTP